MIHNPIVLYKIAEMQHREHIAEANRYWELGLDKIDQPDSRQKRKFILMLTGIVLTTLLMGQGLAF